MSFTDDSLAMSEEKENESININSIDLNQDGLIEEHIIQLDGLLNKSRALVSIVQKSSNILRHVRARRCKKGLKVDIIKDFKYRWNYNNLLIIRLLLYQDIIKELTFGYRKSASTAKFKKWHLLLKAK